MRNVSRYLDRRQRKRHNRFVASVSWRSSLAVIFICVVFLSSTTSQGQSDASATTDNNTLVADENVLLLHLTDEELESICTSRGFELLREENGVPLEFTHDDYLEAAKRCLEMEFEMIEMLEKNPELAVELKAEIDRMTEEKDRLEKEQEGIVAEKEELESRLQEAVGKESIGSKSNTTQAPRAFGMGGSKIDVSKKVNDTTEDLGVMDLDSSEENATSTQGTAKKDRPAAPTTSTTTGNSGSNQTNSESVNETETTVSVVSQTPTEVLSVKEVFKEIFGELFLKVEDDIKRVITLMLPVLKTMTTASNTAMKYLRLLSNYAQTTLSEYQQKSNKNSDDATNKAGQKQPDSKQQQVTATSSSE